MQAALCFPPSTLPLLTPTKFFSSPKNPISKLQTSPFPPLRATSKLQETPSTVDYSSTTSVFPAEACEVVGGEACDAEMYPEVKLKAEDGNPRPGRPQRVWTENIWSITVPKRFSQERPVMILEENSANPSTRKEFSRRNRKS